MNPEFKDLILADFRAGALITGSPTSFSWVGFGLLV